jgi:hypothetical protein
VIQLAVKDERHHTNRKDNCVSNDGSRIKAEFVTDGRLGAESMKLINATSGNSSRSSRISSRAISGSDDVVLFHIETAHLGLMNSAAVIATGSRSSESLNLALLSFPVVGNDAHRVTGFDLLNFLPANQMAGEWIDDFNSLVIENDCGMKKDLKENRTYKGSPNSCNHSAGEAIIKEINVDKKANKEEAQDGKNVRARRPEELAIVHEEIFSRAREMRAA